MPITWTSARTYAALNRAFQKLDIDQRCESCVRSDRVPTTSPLAARQPQTRYLEILGASEGEPILDVGVSAQHLASSMLYLTSLAARIVVFVPDCEQFSRAIRRSASRSWELNHVDPRERTAREFLESATHLEVSEVDGHKSEPIDELRHFLLCPRIVARDK
jgi:hypothetical protein